LSQRVVPAPAEAGVTFRLNKPLQQSCLQKCLARLSVGETEAGRREHEDGRSGGVPPFRAMNMSTPGAVRELKVLVVEDNATNQRVQVRMLERLGHRADLAGNGREALCALGQAAYDLVFMDCQMPEMDGFEATAEIRRREKDTRRTTIIAMTANALEGDRDRCLAAGMDDYLTKPVKLDDLDSAIRKWDATSRNPSPVPQP